MPLGAYVIEYAGGRKIRAPIEYGVTLAAINRRHAQPMTHSMYRHAGYIATYLADPFVQEKTDEGRKVTIYGYEWMNPLEGYCDQSGVADRGGDIGCVRDSVRRDRRDGKTLNRLTDRVQA